MNQADLKFVHRHTTRMLLLLVLALVADLIAVTLTFAVFVAVRADGWKVQYGLLSFVAGLAALFGAFYTLRYFRPLVRESEITPERFTCRANGAVTFDQRRQDIETVEVSLGPVDYIHVHLKNGRREDIKPAYFWDFDRLRNDLRACGYSVTES